MNRDYRPPAQEPRSPEREALARLSRAPAEEAREDDAAYALEILRALWRNRLVIAVLTAIPTVLAIFYAFAATPLYTATTTLMLDTREEQVIDIESVVGGLSTNYEIINTEIEVMRSRNLMDRVVEEMGLENDPDFNAELAPPPPAWRRWIGQTRRFLREGLLDILGIEEPAPPPLILGEDSQDFLRRQAAIDALLGSVGVANVEFSYVFTISAVTPDPEKSARIANKIAELYILNQLEVKFEATRQATAWLSDRVAELKAELERAEAAVEEYGSATTLVSEEALEALGRQLKDLRSRAAELERRRAETAARIEALAELRAAGDFAALAARSGDPRIEREATALLAAGEDGDDGARAARLERLDALLAREVGRLRAELGRAEDQAASVARSIDELTGQIEVQSRDLVELRQLQREAEASRLIYEYFLGRMKETSVQQGIQQADARVLSPAIPPKVRSSPNRRLIVAGAGVGGLFLAMLAVLAVAMTRTSVHTPEELEAITGLPVMGVIPNAPTRRRRSVLEYVVRKPASSLAEAIRNLRTSILMSNIDREPKVIMVCSSVPGEGKTTTALLLAQNSAMLGKKVLLIEGDLRRRTFTTYFDVASEEGLLSILSGERTLAETVHHDKATRTDVLIGDEGNVNAADVFSSDRFAEFVAEARTLYDFVFIDTPPVLAVPDARVISAHADAIVYTVKWNSTSRELVRAGIDLFAQVNARITGLVMTQTNLRKLSRYGYHGYGYGYGYKANRYYSN